jgi:hypothetical protein
MKKVMLAFALMQGVAGVPQVVEAQEKPSCVDTSLGTFCLVVDGDTLLVLPKEDLDKAERKTGCSQDSSRDDLCYV